MLRIMDIKKYIVCYDMLDNRKRSKVFKRLKDYGKPVQKSVFECLLNSAQVEKMWREISGFIDIENDIVMLYQLDNIKDSAIKSLGFYIPEEIQDELIIL